MWIFIFTFFVLIVGIIHESVILCVWLLVSLCDGGWFRASSW